MALLSLTHFNYNLITFACLIIENARIWSNLICSQEEIVCKDHRKCIPLSFVCDSKQDCLDNSDENECDDKCIGNRFKCKNGLCIPSSWLCDSVDDCQDGSDENECLNLDRVPCSNGFYRCQDGPCIPVSKICDGVKNCLKNDDEIKCKFSEFRTESTEINKTPSEEVKVVTVNNTFKWDFFPRTAALETRTSGQEETESSTIRNDFDDETRTYQPVQDNFRFNPLVCTDQEFKCVDQYRCIPKSARCDKKYDCVDKSDEKGCVIFNCNYGLFRCQAGKCVISSWNCDSNSWSGRRIAVSTQDFEAFL